MLEIHLKEHEASHSLLEVARLFATAPRYEAGCIRGNLVQGADLRLTVGVDRPMTREDFRGLGSQDAVTVFSALHGGQHLRERCQPFLARRVMKRQLYQLLSEALELRWPWGSLTGIRPTQIAAECLEELGKENAFKSLVEAWGLAPHKADLALVTAAAEQSILRALPPQDQMVYVGIPFCPGRCSYCSFITKDAGRYQGQLARYTEALIAEIRQVFAGWPQQISAVYLGGGTPTSLPDEDFARLLSAMRRYIPMRAEAEFTVEAGRPDTISDSKLALIKEAGATRLCINPQTMKAESLETIGRFHTPEDCVERFEQARAYGFDNINMDLILGLPGEGPDDLLRSLEALLALGPEGITVHSLALKRSARLNELARADYLPLSFPDPPMAEALVVARERLEGAGYAPYYLYKQKVSRGGLENTGFAKPGTSCLYNVGMMSDQVSVLGFGSGASTKRIMGGLAKRQHNSKDLLDYEARVDDFVRAKRELFAR